MAIKIKSGYIFADRAMEEVFGAKYSSLHVRVTNRGAFHLYNKTLGYHVNDREEKYYADGEDAFDMRKTLGGGSKTSDAAGDEAVKETPSSEDATTSGRPPKQR